MFISEEMDRNEIETHNRILLNNKKEWIPDKYKRTGIKMRFLFTQNSRKCQLRYYSRKIRGYLGLERRLEGGDDKDTSGGEDRNLFIVVMAV